MPETKEKATEELILEAAMKVFTERGFDGARTEDIAKEAGINRALLHYYFRDKQTMFNLIFETRFKEFFGGIFHIFGSDKNLVDKIKSLIEHEITVFIGHPDLARFIIGEVANHPERLIEQGKKLGINPRAFLHNFEAQVQAEVKSGNIRPIAGRQLLMNIMSLCIYPFVARPIIRTMMELDNKSFDKMMEERKKEVYQFIMNALKP
jgi:TetR/AcrR family transcriptional regulator